MLILASRSPRRRELLSLLGVEFTIDVADIDESTDPSLSPAENVARISEKKARAAAEKHHDDLILSADTIVVVDDQILGKPRDEQEACRMLRHLSGRAHTVMTSFCLLQGGQLLTHVEKTGLRFKPLSQEEIEAYVATGSPLDKAGAYGIQDQAAVFVEALDGDYYNVMGLPIAALTKALRSMGVAVLGTVKP